jgi:hypothetical protein
MGEDQNLFKKLLEKLLKEAFTTVLLVLISYYFITKERETNSELIKLYRDDREVLLKTIEKRTAKVYTLYDELKDP